MHCIFETENLRMNEQQSKNATTLVNLDNVRPCF